MKYLRVFFAITFTVLLSVGRAYAQDTAGSIDGVIVDSQGAPVAGASVTIQPARAQAVRSDSAGKFTIANVPSGVYTLTARKPGFIEAGITSITVPLPYALRVAMTPVTLSTLQQIATVTTTAHNAFNTSTSAIANLSQQDFIDQGQLQIAHVIDQIPGVVSARPGTANSAVPGSITSPNLRGAQDYEKATLIDGHPLINGGRGDYPTMLVDSLLFSDIEVVKGPTAYAPEINYGIGGTINFRTADPTYTPTGVASVGFDNYSGMYGNLRISDTIGKLGYVFNIVSDGTQGPLKNYATNIALPFSTSGANTTLIGGEKLTKNPVSAKPINGATGPYPTAGVLGAPSAAYTTLVACCQYVNSNFIDRGELAKIQYHVSQSTVLTAGFVGIQAEYNSPAGSLTQFDSTFAPTGAYSGAGQPFASGQQFLLNNTTTLSDQQVFDNEPMFESEIRSTLRNDTVLARYYSAVLARQTVSDWPNPTSPYSTNMTLYGTAYLNGSATPTAFNGQNVNVEIPAASAFTNNTSDHDYLHGVSFQYDHPVGDAVYTFIYDKNTSLTNSYKFSGGAAETESWSVAPGTRQDFTTYALRGVLPVGDRGQLTLTDYQNVYFSHFTPCCTSTTFTFADSTTAHNDPRLGYTYRVTPDAIVRFSAGSSVAPPYPALIDNLNTTPAQVMPSGGTITISQNSGALKPETSFAYDLGTDIRLHDGAILSADGYLTNIWNQFFTSITDTGTAYNGSEVFSSTNANLAQSRYEGLELSLHRDPRVGWGYTLSGDLARAYAYNVPAGFYATATSPFGTNLGVVPGINVYSVGTGVNGVGNKSEAYSMGYVAVHHRGSYGQFAEFGLTDYGSNNTYNIPAFTVASATYRQPLRNGFSIQLSGDNLFAADSLRYVYYGAGNAAILAPLANGDTSYRGQVPYGPPTFRLILSKSLGVP